MSYLVLARKYRPQTFEDVYAQEHITRTLQNAIRMDRIAHAFLFTGPRGVGKTSMARILSKGLNCLESDRPTAEPCNKCQNCVEITEGNSPDVIEIDGASNTGVDDIRELQRELMYTTTRSRFKIYIIDEVHMLSKNAFNALLKTLEEPPENVVFIFATTEPHKILPTIISRCQRYDFRRIPIDRIIDQLKTICEKDNIQISEDALFLIARKADGGMRDALSLLDQVISFGLEKIDMDVVMNIFGILPTQVFIDIITAVAERKSETILRLLHNTMEQGFDLVECYNGLMDTCRQLLLLKSGVQIPEIAPSVRDTMSKLTEHFSQNDLLYILTFLINGRRELKSSSNPLLLAETGFIKLTRYGQMRDVESLIQATRNPPVAQSSDDYRPVEREIRHIRSEKAQEAFEQKIEESRPKFDSVNEEVVRQHWNILVQRVQQSYAMAGPFLQDAEIIGVERGVIRLRPNTSTAESMLEKATERINEIFSNYFGQPVKVRLVKPQEKKQEYIRNPTVADIRKEHPNLADFIEATDSTIESYST